MTSDSLNHHCPTCNNTYFGAYCNVCGEKTLQTSEMTMKHFFRKVWNAITFSDAKFARSLITLLFYPGKLTTEYFKGRRKLYSAPLSLFFFVNLIYFIYQPVDAINSTLGSQTTGQFYSPWAEEVVKAKMEKEQLDTDAIHAAYNAMTNQVSKLGLIVFVFLFALGYAVININKRDLFYKYIITATHYVSFAVLSTLILIPTLIIAFIYLYVWTFKITSLDINPNAWYFLWPLTFLLFLYGAIMQRRLFKDHLLVYFLKTLLIPIALIAAMLVYRWLLFIVTINLI